MSSENWNNHPFASHDPLSPPPPRPVQPGYDTTFEPHAQVSQSDQNVYGSDPSSTSSAHGGPQHYQDNVHGANMSPNSQQLQPLAPALPPRVSTPQPPTHQQVYDPTAPQYEIEQQRLNDLHISEPPPYSSLNESFGASTYEQDSKQAPSSQGHGAQPPLPARGILNKTQLPSTAAFQPPPQRIHNDFHDDDPSSPVNYVRDPHKLIAYIVPFPKPLLHGVDPATIPDRFMIYTPPPPPLSTPKEGEKEGRVHKLQRKWESEVREAKTSDAKVTSWKGAKGRATKGINWAMGSVKSSGLDFVNRMPSGKEKDQHDPHSDDSNHPEGDTTSKTVGLNEMILFYPSTLQGTPEELRENFVSTMLRTKSKAQRDAVLATGLLPVAFGIDVLATLIWPFGGLAEIDAVWGVASIRGAKTARSVTKRLNSTGDASKEGQLQLTFTPSPRLDVLRAFLAGECHMRDLKMFPSAGPAPTETEALHAIGWSPAQIGGETKNWEDEQWELSEVKDDLKMTMHKAAREWEKWCKAFEKNPEKALKK